MNYVEILNMECAEEWLALNAKLQQKKNQVRKALKEKGILKREGNNTYDKYKYFSEAQYKELFTGLFADAGLELKFVEVAYDTFDGPEKQANGRMPKLEFNLMDIETGFGETTVITAEGIDKGDKAGYKAYTGALKYYLANTFMVATGDDPETESPDNKMNTKVERKNDKKEEAKITPKQIEYLSGVYTGEKLTKLCEANNITGLADLTLVKASELISKIKAKMEEKNG